MCTYNEQEDKTCMRREGPRNQEQGKVILTGGKGRERWENCKRLPRGVWPEPRRTRRPLIGTEGMDKGSPHPWAGDSTREGTEPGKGQEGRKPCGDTVCAEEQRGIREAWCCLALYCAIFKGKSISKAKNEKSYHFLKYTSKLEHMCNFSLCK